jgi:ubiquinone/menaquinone biosynthesis C-methylase UbiE
MSECVKYDSSVQTRGRTLDYAAGVYDVLSPVMTFYQEQRLGRRAIELLDLKGNERVIDIGCGTGSLTIEIGRKLSAENGLVVGIDAAAKMIRLARKKAIDLKQVQFDIMAAERLGYEDESFDGAVSTFFFHHIDVELKVAALNEMWRVLKKGKQAIIIDVDITTTLFGKICAWSGYILFRQEQIRENIEGKLRSAMTESNFGGYRLISTHMGYVSIFVVSKGV